MLILKGTAAVHCEVYHLTLNEEKLTFTEARTVLVGNEFAKGICNDLAVI